MPVGKYQFRVWHEIPGIILLELPVTVSAGVTTDIGVILVPAEKFADAARSGR